MHCAEPMAEQFPCLLAASCLLGRRRPVELRSPFDNVATAEARCVDGVARHECAIVVDVSNNGHFNGHNDSCIVSTTAADCILFGGAATLSGRLGRRQTIPDTWG